MARDAAASANDIALGGMTTPPPRALPGARLEAVNPTPQVRSRGLPTDIGELARGAILRGAMRNESGDVLTGGKQANGSVAGDTSGKAPRKQAACAMCLTFGISTFLKNGHNMKSCPLTPPSAVEAAAGSSCVDSPGPADNGTLGATAAPAAPRAAAAPRRSLRDVAMMHSRGANGAKESAKPDTKGTRVPVATVGSKRPR